MAWLLVLPVLIPLLTAAATLLAGGSWKLRRGLSVAGAGLTFGATVALLSGIWQNGPMAVQLSNWAAPFGITFVADLLSAVMAVIGATLALATVVYALGSISERRERLGFHPLFHALLMGINGAFLTGDLFNLYVWFEIVLIASFSLLVIGGGREQLRGGIQYVVLKLVSSMLFLAAIGLLYGTTGTMNLADMSIKLADVDPALITTVAMLFLVAFGIKSALFPVFFWLPPSYPTPPIAIIGFFAGMLTKVGVYAMIRLFTLLFTQDIGYTHHTLLLWAAGLTMITGVLGAAVQSDIRRILAFHSVSQIGYMVMGLALYTPLALAGSVFYFIHYIIVKSNLFFIGGVAYRLRGEYNVYRIGGLYRDHPYLAILFIIPAFALVGFPPLSGFWAKLVLVKAGLEVEAYWIVAAALGTGVLTLYSMTKIWANAFWAPHPEDGPTPPADSRSLAWMVVPIAALAGMTVIIGLGAEPFLQVAETAAAQLMDTSAYVEAVLGPEALAPVAPEVAPPTPSAALAP